MRSRVLFLGALGRDLGARGLGARAPESLVAVAGCAIGTGGGATDKTSAVPTASGWCDPRSKPTMRASTDAIVVRIVSAGLGKRLRDGLFSAFLRCARHARAPATPRSEETRSATALVDEFWANALTD